MKHECNAYCKGNRHVTVGFSSIRSRVVDPDHVADEFGPHARVVSVESAREAPIPAWATREGLIYASLITIEVPETATVEA